MSFEYTPSTLPGARLPHIWLDDGQPIQDVLGREYTLLVMNDDKTGLAELAESFARVGAPFRIYRPESKFTKSVYGGGLILVRPDLHIVWKGDAFPKDPAGLVLTVTGNGSDNR